MKAISRGLALFALVSLACSLLPLGASETSPPTATQAAVSDEQAGDDCPGDCPTPEAMTAAETATAAATTEAAALAPGPEPDTYWVTNPSSGARLYVQVLHPRSWSGGALPTLVLVPGGSSDSSSFTRTKPTAPLLAEAGFTVVVFDPDGRGLSGGEEDYDGTIHQDGLAAVVRAAATLPEVDTEQIGLVSFSFGVTMASGALARYPDLPARFLIDWEGPADRNDTGGCDAAGTGHLEDIADCGNESFWATHEAVTFIGQIGVPYQRLQSEKDHAQPDVTHALIMVNAAVQGGAPWVRLNDLPPDQTYDLADPPRMLPDSTDRHLETIVAEYAGELLALP